MPSASRPARVSTIAKVKSPESVVASDIARALMSGYRMSISTRACSLVIIWGLSLSGVSFWLAHS